MDYSKEAVSVFNDLAQRYEDKYMSVERYTKELNLFCDSIPSKGSVLELACGPGNVTKYILNQRNDLIYTATDMSTNMIDLAAKNNEGISTQILDCRDLSSLHESYNGAVSAFCLPYLNEKEVKANFHDVYSLLKDDGVFYLSGIKGDYENSAYTHSISNPSYKIFMHYYDEQEIVKILRNIGFKLIMNSVIQYQNDQNDDTFEFAILVQK